MAVRLAYSKKMGRRIRQDDMKHVGIPTLTIAEQMIHEGKIEEGLEWVDYMREEYKIIHDFMVNWTQDLMQFIADRLGEQAVFEAVEITYEKAWKERYKVWNDLTPEEKVQLSVEGMRGHFSGASRRGEVIVKEEEDRYVLSFDPCGSGGVLRRGDPEVNGQPYSTDGVNKQEHDWTWGKKGVHWYCTHCCIATEYLSVRDLSYILRPLEHSLNHEDPCKWYIYKNPQQTPDIHYKKIGMKSPSSQGSVDKK